MDAISFIKSILNYNPWEPKQSTLNRLVDGYMDENKSVVDRKQEVKEIKDAIKELEWRGDLKVLAGLGWATGDVEFLFRALPQ